MTDLIAKHWEIKMRLPYIVRVYDEFFVDRNKRGSKLPQLVRITTGQSYVSSLNGLVVSRRPVVSTKNFQQEKKLVMDRLADSQKFRI